MSTVTRLMCAAVLLAGGAAVSGNAAAKDNSHIVIIDRQQHATPFGSYENRRHLQVFGPSSGFRYRERRHRSPRISVDRGDHGYNGRHGGLQPRFAPGVRGAWPRPRGKGHIRGHRHDPYRNPYGHQARRHHRDGIRPRSGLSSPRSYNPSGRAIQPPQRAIR